MAVVSVKPLTWSMERDRDTGHRTYKITFRVRSDDRNDGPRTIEQADELPRPGVSVWNYFGDEDPAAVCTRGIRIEPQEGEREPWLYWLVECEFTTKPLGQCQDEDAADDPLQERPKVRFTSRKERREATHDAYENPCLSSSFERIRGASTEVEETIPVLEITQNVPTHSAVTAARLTDCVNHEPLYGFAAGEVRLAEVHADQQYSARCTRYWERSVRLEIRRGGWARQVLDEGTKVLRGRFDENGVYVVDADADAKDPRDFIPFVGKSNQPDRVILNGAGLPAGVMVSRPGFFVCIAAHTGRPLSDRDHWLPVLGGYDTQAAMVERVLRAEPYSSASAYRAGWLVAGLVPYVAILDTVGGEPPGVEWLALPALTDRDAYDATASYAVGDYVDGSADETTAGYVTLDFFPPADLRGLLNLPQDADVTDPD